MDITPILIYMDITPILISFVTIFIIMDPFASLPFFLALTQGHKNSELARTANKAVLIAGLLALVFVFTGTAILNVLSITLSDFRIAGGIVLGLLGLENVLGFSFSNHLHNKSESLDSAAVLIATPLLTGPGLITSLVVLTHEYGTSLVLISLLAALFLSWLILRNAVLAKKLLGDKIIIIFSKVMGLLLIAMGIAYMRAGLLG